MVKLSDMARAASNYVKLYGDKEVTSIGTYNGSSDGEYTICVHDVYTGPIGKNPFSGADEIRLMKDGSAASVQHEGILDEISDEQGQGVRIGINAGLKKLEKQLYENNDIPVHLKVTMIYGALQLICSMGYISRIEMRMRWSDIALKYINLC